MTLRKETPRSRSGPDVPTVVMLWGSHPTDTDVRGTVSVRTIMWHSRTGADIAGPAWHAPTAGAPREWTHARQEPWTGPSAFLFGRMFEDPAIELAAFAERRRIAAILSAGCTALRLAVHHDVVGVDIDPAQVAYVRRRLDGAGAEPGVCDRLMASARSLAPLGGWTPDLVHAFLDLDDPEEQRRFWRCRLDTLRFRIGVDVLFSRAAFRLRRLPAFVRLLPPGFGPILRARLARGFGRHPNRSNPYARALLQGEWTGPGAARRREVPAMALVHADAAAYLERAPRGAFDGFTLSNVLDGASAGYARRLCDAVRRAAAPGAVAVVRSFVEPTLPCPGNRAADDRSLLWGVVDVGPAATLGSRIEAWNRHSERRLAPRKEGADVAAGPFASRERSDRLQGVEDMTLY